MELLFKLPRGRVYNDVDVILRTHSWPTTVLVPVFVMQPVQPCNISVLVADNQNVNILGVTKDFLNALTSFYHWTRLEQIT
jgi:hypothetical protein